jgi:hypothetical protein
MEHTNDPHYCTCGFLLCQHSRTGMFASAFMLDEGRASLLALGLQKFTKPDGCGNPQVC